MYVKQNYNKTTGIKKYEKKVLRKYVFVFGLPFFRNTNKKRKKSRSHLDSLKGWHSLSGGTRSHRPDIQLVQPTKHSLIKSLWCS
jgi:hypothetical protein